MLGVPDVRRLLVVEDERHLALGLKMNFELEGFSVDLASNGRDAIRALASPHPHDLILLDVMLPDMSGIDLCQRIRDAGNRTPILMLTARRATDDRVRGLEAGADDYLLKPFELSELLARVHSLLRRRRWDRVEARSESTPPHGTQSVLRLGRAEINFDTHEARLLSTSPDSPPPQTLRLTRLEIDLLKYFAQNAGRVISREELLSNVWEVSQQLNTRSVDNFIVRLRRYFEPNPVEPIFFLSVRGSGYRFEPAGVGK